MAHPGDVFLAVDVETSGQDMQRNFLVCIGAAVVDAESNQVRERSDEFLVYLTPPRNKGWEPRCLRNFWCDERKAINGRTQYTLLEEAWRQYGAYPPSEALDMFVSYVQRMVKKYPRLIVLTDTTGYDLAWLDYALQHFTHHSRPFDSMAYCTGDYRTPWNVTAFYRGLARCGPHRALSEASNAEQEALVAVAGERARFPDFGVQHDHNPLHDARLMAHRAIHIIQLLK